MDCPHCKIKLIKSVENGISVEVSHCPECKGKAISKNSFSCNVSNKSIQEIFNLVPHKMNTISCPNCSSKMYETIFDPDKAYLKLDLCNNCDYIWFDYTELNLLKKSNKIKFNEAKEHYKNISKELNNNLKVQNTINNAHLKNSEQLRASQNVSNRGFWGELIYDLSDWFD